MTMDTAGNSAVDPELREHLENLEVEVTLSSVVRGFIWAKCWLLAQTKKLFFCTTFLVHYFLCTFLDGVRPLLGGGKVTPFHMLVVC